MWLFIPQKPIYLESWNLISSKVLATQINITSQIFNFNKKELYILILKKYSTLIILRNLVFDSYKII